MWWIEGMCNRDGKLLASLVNKEGLRKEEKLCSVPLGWLKVSRNSSFRATVNPSSFKRGYAQEYLKLSGFSCALAGRHEVFETYISGYRCLIPAFVLINALICSLVRLEETLFRPAGLENGFFLSPDFQADGSVFSTASKVGFFAPLRIMGHNLSYKLAWFLGFPSASYCWRSIFDCALEGSLNLSLPLADLDCVVSGRIVSKTRLVERLTVVSIEPTEAPFDPKAFPAKSKFEFHMGTERDNLSHLKPPTAMNDEELSKPGMGGTIKDEEWWLFGYLLGKTPKLMSASRITADIIINKLTTAAGWSAFPGTYVTYRRWVKAGQWQKFRESILAYRQAEYNGLDMQAYVSSLSRRMLLSNWYKWWGLTGSVKYRQKKNPIPATYGPGNMLFVLVRGNAFREVQKNGIECLSESMLLPAPNQLVEGTNNQHTEV